MLELVAAFEQSNDTASIANIWAKRNGQVIENPPRPWITDLDCLPSPAETVLYKYKDFDRWYYVLTSRGCPFKCSYCFNSLLERIYQGKGPLVRRRSVDSVIKEVKYAKDEYGVKRFSFEDDVFTIDLEWLKEFCARYKQEIGLPFRCQVHAQFITREKVKLLEDAGCVTVGLGIQTLNQQLKEGVLHRYETNQQFINAMELFKDSPISVAVYVLLNFPGQDDKELIDLAKFLNRLSPDTLLPFWFRCYPRTDIVRIALDRQFLTASDVAKIEKSKEYAPFVVGARIFYKKETSPLVNLVLISSFLSGSVFNLILEKKLYRSKLLFSGIGCHLYSMFANTVKKLFKGKKEFFYYSLSGQLRFYGYYTLNLWLKNTRSLARRFRQGIFCFAAGR